MSSLSSQAPRYFISVDLPTASPFIFISPDMHLLTRTLLPKSINSDLALFIFNLTEFIHDLMLAKLVISICLVCISSASMLGANSFTIAWSSAKAMMPRLGLINSLIVIPEQEPCGTENVSSFSCKICLF